MATTKTMTVGNVEVERSQAARLTDPFPPSVIKKVRQGGVELDYIPVAEVVKRMNDVLEPGNWSAVQTFIGRDEKDPDWIVAQAEVTATIDGQTSTRSGDGAVKIKMFRNQPGPVNLGHDYKSAFSEAVKKACQWFGVGLYLSMPDDEPEVEEYGQSSAPQSPQAAPPPAITDDEWTQLMDHMGKLDDTQKGIVKEWWSLQYPGKKFVRSITRVQWEELLKRVTVELFNAEATPDGPF